MLRRVWRTCIVCFAATVSILAFPSVLSAVITCWLVASVVWFRQHRTKSAAASLVFAAGLAIQKGPLTAALFGLVACLLATAALLSTRPRRSIVIATIGLSFGALAFFAFDRYSSASSQLSAGRGAIVCLGDSLTSGLPSVGGYPDELRRLGDWQVEDFGFEGITSDEAFVHLPRIGALRPRIVVVELGGHDFLRGHGRGSTKSNLVRIIQECRQVDAEVLLCEIPRGFIVDPYYGLEREIAREHHVRLIPDTMIRKLVFFSPYAPPGLWLPSDYLLSDDGLHPNARGNRMLAASIANEIRRAE